MPNHKYSKLDEKIKPWQIENAQRKNIVWFFKKSWCEWVQKDRPGISSYK